MSDPNYILCQTLGTPEGGTKVSNAKQRAVAQTSFLWDIGATIRIYIMTSPMVISEITYNVYRTLLVDMSNYIFWRPIPDVTASELDPLYNEIQGKVTPKVLIERVVERLRTFVNLNFVFVNEMSDSDVRIKFDSLHPYSSSTIGKRALESQNKNLPTMILNCLDVATTFHEFGHTLGLYHEHQNPLGNPIKWDMSALVCIYGLNIRNNFQPLTADITNGSQYDPRSIMIYSFPNAINCGIQGMKTLTDTPAISANYKFSYNDIRWLQAMYPFVGPRNKDIIYGVTTLNQELPINLQNDITTYYLNAQFTFFAFCCLGLYLVTDDRFIGNKASFMITSILISQCIGILDAYHKYYKDTNRTSMTRHVSEILAWEALACLIICVVMSTIELRYNQFFPRLIKLTCIFGLGFSVIQQTVSTTIYKFMYFYSGVFCLMVPFLIVVSFSSINRPIV